MPLEVPGKTHKGNVLLANAVENSDRAIPFGGEADDPATGTAELALNGPHLFHRRAEMGLEKLVENFHECGSLLILHGEAGIGLGREAFGEGGISAGTCT